MPAIAIASAIDPAPAMPACSNSGAKARPGRRAAGERDGSGEDAEQRWQVECSGDQDAEHVLRDGEDRRDHEQQHHLRTAGAQQRQAGSEPDAREERDHQRAL
jgi:hypothetical protein